MKILSDECVTRKIKSHLDEYDVCTVFEMGWSGFKNGNLIGSAISISFDILLTIDKNIFYQQNMSNYNIAIVILDVESSKIEYIIELLSEFKRNILTYHKQHCYLIKSK
jgi:hypothetical protein